ncbi:hypothetical protein [Thalassotalea sp. PS06]|uniref:hypothetical protein n=1 Tax=Thalassotalea sp. PS06 TaxID=2594005 RepID=UPI001164A9C9|nr:hypothetical protein [Thalassotalea sp. PS06]QDP02191.1 hypothetical protein FNC98_13080 [Thalassotalea sp. PS06]
MKQERPINFKQIVDFVAANNERFSAKDLRQLYRVDITKFIVLLDEAIGNAGVVPAAVMPFYKEVQQISKLVEQQENLMKNNDQSNRNNENNQESSYNQNQKSFRESLMESVISMYNRIKSFIAGHIDKVKILGATAFALGAAYLTKANASLLVALAALKSGGMFATFTTYGKVAINKVMSAKDAVIERGKHFVLWIKDIFARRITA